MPTYLITYYGAGDPPASAEAREQMMAAFGAWVASVGDRMVDPGTPLGAAKTVSPEGVSDGGPGVAIGGGPLGRGAKPDQTSGPGQSHPLVGRGGGLPGSAGGGHHATARAADRP